MNDPHSPQSASPSGETAPQSPKLHLSVGRIIEWVLIAVFGLVVANEAYSKFSYDATLKSFNELYDEATKIGNNATIGEFDDLVKGMPSRTETPSGQDKSSTRVDYLWRSLFKTYHIVLSGSPNDAGKLAITMLDTNVPLQPEAEQAGNSEVPSSGGAVEGGGSPMEGPGAGGPSGGISPPGAGSGFPGPMGPMGNGASGNGEASRPELEEPEANDEADESSEESSDSSAAADNSDDESTESDSENP